MFFSRINSIEKIRDVLNDMQFYIESNTNDENNIFNSRLVACELVTNVLVHSKCPALLQVNYYSEKIEIVVESESCFVAENIKDNIDASSPCGRGLFIVNSLCEKLYRDGKKTTAILKN